MSENQHLRHAKLASPDDFLFDGSPPVHGLVLAGGQSRRMGRDKGQLHFHGKPQREFLVELLANLGLPVWTSCRAEQVSEFPENQRLIPDTFLDLGPFGAILSAFRSTPWAAWLVVACDLPLLDANTLKFLLENRRPESLATAFRSPSDGLPEPLITIWEPKAYPELLQFLSKGMSCPRKVLCNSEIQLLDAPNPAALTNVNTPEDLAELGRIGNAD